MIINRTLLATYLNQLRDKRDLEGIHIFLEDVGVTQEKRNHYITKFIERDDFGNGVMTSICTSYPHYSNVMKENLIKIQKKFILIYNR